MALNAYVTPTGGEIGYAQAVQAWAAGVPPQVSMNPILLKPQGNMTSQVILRGEAVGQVSAENYYKDYFDRGWEAITQSLEQLSYEFDLVVCEGAGSPAEINLKHRDLTNMRVAKHLNAVTLLVVDIDRGGAFAHVVGTLELLDPEERSLIKGIVINKFRGQRSLLQSGIEWLEKYTGIPVLGVIPWLDMAFPAEDSLSLLERDGGSSKGSADLTIAVLRLPHIANFTDFDPLDSEPSVKLQYLSPYDHLGYPDAVIIPGSKTTISDLMTLRKSGMAQELKDYVAGGGTLLGICGGFQMLGKIIADPEGLEGEEGRYPGLDLLPIQTVILGKKVARQRSVTSCYPQEGLPITGFEIHQGRTSLISGGAQHCLFDDPQLGIVSDNQGVWGTYLHGIFDNGPWRRMWLNRLRKQRGLLALPTGVPNYREQRELILDILSDRVAEHLNVRPLLS